MTWIKMRACDLCVGEGRNSKAIATYHGENDWYDCCRKHLKMIRGYGMAFRNVDSDGEPYGPIMQDDIETEEATK